MKIFYTERDIIDMCAAGVRRLEVGDNVVLTDLAREKAQQLGLVLAPADHHENQPQAPVSTPTPTPPPALSQADLLDRVKAGVIAKLGTDAYNDLLDQVIPQVLARLELSSRPVSGQKKDSSTPAQTTNY